MQIASLLVDRRTFLTAALGLPLALAACDNRGEDLDNPAAPTTLPPTPPCDDGDGDVDGGAPTPTQTEGPYFTPDSPEKRDFRGDVSGGTAMALTGTVLTTACRPVTRALLDVWHADDEGAYDNDGYRLRGHLFTDEAGRFRLDTVVPGNYAGRTRHLHVKVQAPGGPVLTTQLYFPDEPANGRDSLHRPELEMRVQRGATVDASFTFVVQA